MQQLQVILKNEKSRSYDRLAIFFFILSAVAMGIIWFYADPKKMIIKSEYWLLLTATYHVIPVALLIRKKTANNSRLLLYSSFFLAAFWIVIEFWWVGIIVAAVTVLYTISQRVLRVIVNEGIIIYPSFPKKRIDWRDLNNVILKDGLLTIDSKNDKIIQQLIDAEKTEINEKKFNDFCQQQLKRRQVV